MDFKKLIRYRTLDKCFSAKDKLYTLDDLFEAIRVAYTEYGFAEDIKLRQLRYDIQFMKSEDGWGILLEEGLRDGKKGVYRYKDRTYSILNTPVHEMEQDYLKMAMFVLDRFKTQEGLEWVNELMPKIEQELMQMGRKKRAILFDKNPYTKGLEHIDGLFEAIVDKTVLSIQYEPFGKPVLNIELHPYLLKEYNNRWYIVGRNPKHSNLTTLGLDRIMKIEHCFSNKFVKSAVDVDAYFEDILGITRPNGAEVETIQLRFSKGRANYVLTKPIHDSQKGKKLNEDGTLDVSLCLIDNQELKQTLLQFGSDVEVLAPLTLRTWFREETRKTLGLYCD